MPIDLRGICEDPLEATRRTGGLNFVLDVAFDKLRDLPPIVPPWDYNPFFLTAMQYLEDPHLTYENSALRSFFDKVVPNSAAEILESTSNVLAQIPAREAALPWRRRSGPEQRKANEKRAEIHARQYGLALSGADGHYSHGPISPEKGEFEFKRLTHVIDSIARNGYCPRTPFENVTGQILEANGKWAISIFNGTHRTPALRALGYELVPVLILTDKIYKRSNCDNWPGVRSGDISRDEALALFDRVFYGQDSTCLKKYWDPERTKLSQKILGDFA